MNNFVGLEGHSFAGKTTLLEDLKATNLFNIIEEHDHYAGGAENFPDIRFKSQKEMIDDVEFFIDLEIKRCQDAEQMYKENGKPVVIDRTIISVILFHKYLKEKKKGWLDGFDYSLKRYQEEIDKKKIFIPSRVIFIEPINTETFKRRSKRGVSIEFYKKVSTFNFMRTNYEDWFNLFAKGSIRKLLSKDGLNGRKKVSYDAIEFIQNSNVITNTKSLINIYRKRCLM